MPKHDQEGKEISDVASMKRDSRTIKVSWNKENDREVALAKKKFSEYVRQGWFAFTITSDKEKVQIFTFDPALEEIFLIPLAEGG